MLLRRRRRCCCSGPGPLLLLLGAALCVFYQTLMSASNWLRSGPQPAQVRGRKSPHDVTEETRRVIHLLESLQWDAKAWGASQKPPRRRRAVVLTGRHQASDPEVQLYQQVLQQLHYDVHTSRYTETSGVLQASQGESGWSLLVCLSSSERSCLRRVAFSHLQRHQRVNLIPGLMDAFSDAGAGLCQMFTWSHLAGDLPMRPYSCGSANQELQMPLDSLSAVGAPPPGLVAMVNTYVLVTSLQPLTSFLHDVIVVSTNREPRARPLKLRDLVKQQLGPVSSHHALGLVKYVIGEVLQAAVSANERTGQVGRCVLCYQLLTFTLMFSGSITPVVVQVDTDFTLSALRDDTFDRQVTKDLILKDTLHFLSAETDRRDGGRGGSDDLRLSEAELLLLLQFHRQVSAPSAFHLLLPSSSSSSSSSPRPLSVSDHMIRISWYYDLLRNNSSPSGGDSSNQGSTVTSLGGAAGRCVDPHLRQIYTDPPLTLTPPFSPAVKEYCAEVTFDTVTVRIRPTPVSPSCAVHLDEHRGPRMANYPLGLGNSRIRILVTDEAEAEPVVMASYTVHVFRENRPILPMFADHVMCSFVQDCGLRVRPNHSCGLQTAVMSQRPRHICTSGHQPGRWVVPCLSCSDNRTCDWREVAWQPDGCRHRLVERPLLQNCMTDRKVLFIGDSTNRGMMYFLIERVNSSLNDWGRAHDMLVHRDLNAGRTLVSYSYYPRFWLEKEQRPTFREALLQLLHRSRPLVNSNLTVLVVGGVQWLNTNHLWTVSEVLDREGLGNILVVVKTLGIGFHLPVDGIRSLSLREMQDLDKDNDELIATAKHHGYEAIDTFSITMGRHKEFLQGRCACHFHEVERFPSFSPPGDAASNRTTSSAAVQNTQQEVEPETFTYHVRGPVNQVYSEILLSRLCPAN